MTDSQSVKFNQLLQQYVAAEIQVKEVPHWDRPEAESIATKARQKLQQYVESLTTENE